MIGGNVWRSRQRINTVLHYCFGLGESSLDHRRREGFPAIFNLLLETANQRKEKGPALRFIKYTVSFICSGRISAQTAVIKKKMAKGKLPLCDFLIVKATAPSIYYIPVNLFRRDFQVDHRRW